MRLEMTETVDVSREGVLIHRNDLCEPSGRVWIVFPYARTIGGSVQPETPARISRVAADEKGGYWVALRLEIAPRGALSPEQERRRAERVPFALPIFVRSTGFQWPEESMTHDISSSGARFETSNVYKPGQSMIAQIPWGEWSKRGQVHGRVVRVQEPHSASGTSSAGNMGVSSVAVEWLSDAAAGLPKA